MFFLKPKYGLRLLGIWLVMFGLPQLITALKFNGLETVLAILAVAAGVLIFMER